MIVGDHVAPPVLLECEGVGAIERVLNDAACIMDSDGADAAGESLSQTLFEAFSTGEERAWRNAYAALAAIVMQCTANDTPALGRLRAFLAENDDLATEPTFAG